MNNMFQEIISCGNPQAFLNKAMQNSKYGEILQTPLGKNAINVINNGTAKEKEEMGRNLLKEMGLNPDEVYKQVTQRFGM